jgi:hypothetical protein
VDIALSEISSKMKKNAFTASQKSLRKMVDLEVFSCTNVRLVASSLEIGN